MPIHLDEISHEIASRPGLHPDERHALLETERRRMLLTVLANAGGAMELDTIAARVDELEGGQQSVTGTDRLARMLHHLDLPVLDAVGIVTYDATQHVVYPNDLGRR